MSRRMKRLVRALSSLRLAVVTMATLGLACIAATFYESSHGTAAAQRVFYRSAWFAGLIALLAASILFSALERYPWNRHHVGFVMAHAGILLLLLGSLVSLHAGLDGQLTLAEGETSDRLSIEGETLHVGLPDGPHAIVPVAFDLRPPAPGARWPVPGSQAALVVEEYRPDARLSDVWAEGVEGQSGSPALQFTVLGQGQRLGGWLMAGQPGPHHIELGPVVFSLHAATDEQEARDLLTPSSEGNQLAFVALPGRNLRYALSTRKGQPSAGSLEAGTASAHRGWTSACGSTASWNARCASASSRALRREAGGVIARRPCAFAW